MLETATVIICGIITIYHLSKNLKLKEKIKSQDELIEYLILVIIAKAVIIEKLKEEK